MTILWWHWLVFGLILALAEMATAGGFYLLFFGIGAVVVGALSFFDGAGSISMQILLFSVLSVASLLLFRSPLMKWMQLDSPGKAVDSLVGDTATPLDDIAAGAVGRAELRGAVWSARNHDAELLVRGQRCTVVNVDRLMIFITAERERS